LYYGGRERWTDEMAHAIALNGWFFHVHRMVQQYVLNACFHGDGPFVGPRVGGG
jgi:hypothetical protein